MQFKMQVVWPEIMKLWNCSRPAEADSWKAAVTSTCELMRDDEEVCQMSTELKHVVSNFLYTMAEATLLQCPKSASQMSERDIQFLNCIVPYLVNILHIAHSVGESPIRFLIIRMVYDLCQCVLPTVRKALAGEFPKICRNILSWMTTERTVSLSCAKPYLGFLRQNDRQRTTVKWAIENRDAVKMNAQKVVIQLQNSYIDLLGDTNRRVRLTALAGLSSFMSAFEAHQWTRATNSRLCKTLGRINECDGTYARSIIEAQREDILRTSSNNRV